MSIVFAGGFLFQESRQASGPRGFRAYAVGDIHGRLDLLDQLLEMIEGDVRLRRRRKTIIVFLGDLIDRGPSSAGVVERLRLYKPSFAKPLFLMGNHEEVMLRVLEGDAELLSDWLKFGGSECVSSYGIDPDALKQLDGAAARDMLVQAIPPAHVEFIRSFVDTVSFGGYLFVHAGIRPRVGLADQRQTDLRWIRQPFLDDCEDHGFIVVHGHTIGEQVEIRSNRIGLDTGAYRTGVLTAMGIEGSERWFLQTGEAIGNSASSDRVQNGSELATKAAQS